MQFDAEENEWVSDRKTRVFQPGGIERLIWVVVTVTLMYWVSSAVGPFLFHRIHAALTTLLGA